MKYEEVIKLITFEFIKNCCKLSKDFNFYSDDKYIKMTYDKTIPIYIKLSDIVDNASNRMILCMLLFQAWIGWNKKNKNYECDLHSSVIGVYKKDTTQTHRACFFIVPDDYEKDKFLSRYSQALICALNKMFELEKTK